MVLVDICEACGQWVRTEDNNIKTKVKYMNIDGRMIPSDYTTVHKVCPKKKE